MTDFSRPPQNEIGIVAPFDAVVNDADDLAVVFVSARVFSRGVQFDFELFHRTATVSLSSWGFGRPQNGGSSAGAHLLGFEWSDGTWSSTMPLDNRGGLHPRGGGGHSGYAGYSVYLDHLPPPGEFTVITAWPYFDLPERQVTFNARVLTDAASRVMRLWEPVDRIPPKRTHEDRLALDDAAVLVVPRTGWFGERFDPTPPGPLLDENGDERHFRMFSVAEDGTRTEITGAAPVGWRLADE
jgi:hypothetical protein